jgi:1-acyl-sn-glycerol-3-phosphate acyltransferase
LYIVWALLVFTVFMLIFLPFFLLPALFGNRAMVVTYFFLRLWSKIFSILNFIPYKISGREHIRKGESYICVSNHTSFLDIPGICLALPGQFRPLAKTELRRIPVFGWIASAATVLVDRTSHESRKESLDRLIDILHKGISVLIFAEGTQNRGTTLLQPFRDGAFRMAVETGRPILPMVVYGAGKLMPPGRFSIRPGKIRISIGAPIQISGTQAQLKKDTYDRMLAMLEQLEAEVKKPLLHSV